MEYIHHYTTIETLALIIENKKIRFTRLDFLDDVEESSSFIEEFNFLASTIFTSCWTQDEEESIPLWKMYSSLYNGVRISMPRDMFNKYHIPKFHERNHYSEIDRISPLTKDETFYNGDYTVTNVFDERQNDFYKKIKYEDGYVDIYKSMIRKEGDQIHFKSMWDWGGFKSKKWEFQKETRFTLYTMPLLQIDKKLIEKDKFIQYNSEYVITGIKNRVEFIDISLNQDAIKKMTITLAPCINPGQRILVKYLVKKYPTIEVVPSSLENSIRK